MFPIPNLAGKWAMKKKWLCLIFLCAMLCSHMALAQSSDGKDKERDKNKDDEKEEKKRTGIPLKFHEQHRGIQWCVNGVDEPEFKRYPWSEFAPILQRRYYKPYLANVRFKYSVDLRPIKVKASDKAKIGNGQNLYQRAHFVFNAKIRREFRHNVKTSYNDTKIEGLLVQVNYAPLGLGMPAIAQFVHPKDFNCNDCEKPIGIPIACRKRTYMHTVHPTILAYHHHMEVPYEEKRRRQQHCLNKLIPNQCIISGFKELLQNSYINESYPNPESEAPEGEQRNWIAYNWTEYNGRVYLGKHLHQPHPQITEQCKEPKDCDDKFDAWFKSKCCRKSKDGFCNKKSIVTTTTPEPNENETTTTEAPIPPVSILCPNKFYQEIEAPERGPGDPPYNEWAVIYEDPIKQSKNWPEWECRPYHATICKPRRSISQFPWETQADLENLKIDQFNLSTQCCLNTLLNGTCAGGHPGNACNDTSTQECRLRVVMPYDQVDNVSTYTPDPKPCEDLIQLTTFPPNSSVHGNLVWYFPPCHYSARVRFQMLVVHSFQKGVYSIIESEKYYDLRAGTYSDPDSVNPHIPSPLFTGFPHECEAEAPTPAFLYSEVKESEQIPFDYSRSYDACVQETGDDINHQICVGVPHYNPIRKKGEKPTAPRCDSSIIKVNYKPKPCEDVCPQLPVTTLETPTTKGWSLIKRSLHGGINIITNFCIMPICVFIARFYKETYNLQGFKGQRTWFWMHMIGSGGSTVLMYMGFFSEKIVAETDAHVVNGNLYIILLGVSYCTSWMRHKKRLYSSVMEATHAACGYGCLILALVCVTNAKSNGEPINSAVKLVVYVALSSLIVFYIGMTAHICSMDRRFGMRPRRWHFPVVESRFEDLPVPGRRTRQFFLFAVLIINLPLTVATLFL